MINLFNLSDKYSKMMLNIYHHETGNKYSLVPFHFFNEMEGYNNGILSFKDISYKGRAV